MEVAPPTGRRHAAHWCPPAPRYAPCLVATTEEGWEGDRVARWVRQSAGLERQLAPVADVLFEAACLQPGERVLDVGCGTGPTTRTAALAVGRAGRVTGVDVSADMIAAAAEDDLPATAADVDWVVADVVEWACEPTFDVVLSRFGVMFFSDPTAAFSNLAGATVPGGRLAMATWARRDESPMFEVPLQAVLSVIGTPAAVPPLAEGPFSLHDAEGIATLVAGAGWSVPHTEIHDLDLPFGGGMLPAEAAAACMDFGPTRIVTADLDDAARAEVVAAITGALSRHVDEAGHVVLEGRILVTTADHP